MRNKWPKLGAREKGRIIQRKAMKFKDKYGKSQWARFAGQLMALYNYPEATAIILSRHHLGVKDELSRGSETAGPSSGGGEQHLRNQPVPPVNGTVIDSQSRAKVPEMQSEVHKPGCEKNSDV
jgi:hypothetical protein